MREKSNARRRPKAITEFLDSKRLAVAGVSQEHDQAANTVFRKLRDSGYEVFPVNPKRDMVEGARCYHTVEEVPGPLHGVVVATRPEDAVEVVRQSAGKQVKHVWFHRSFGAGSVSDQAVDLCQAHHMNAIVGGCPLMYCDPVDFGHRCMHWILKKRGKLPE